MDEAFVKHALAVVGVRFIREQRNQSVFVHTNDIIAPYPETITVLPDSTGIWITFQEGFDPENDSGTFTSDFTPRDHDHLVTRLMNKIGPTLGCSVEFAQHAAEAIIKAYEEYTSIQNHPELTS